MCYFLFFFVAYAQCFILIIVSYFIFSASKLFQNITHNVLLEKWFPLVYTYRVLKNIMEVKPRYIARTARFDVNMARSGETYLAETGEKVACCGEKGVPMCGEE